MFGLRRGKCHGALLERDLDRDLAQALLTSSFLVLDDKTLSVIKAGTLADGAQLDGKKYKRANILINAATEAPQCHDSDSSCFALVEGNIRTVRTPCKGKNDTPGHCATRLGTELRLRKIASPCSHAGAGNVNNKDGAMRDAGC